jgi:hypothetical protein
VTQGALKRRKGASVKPFESRIEEIAGFPMFAK